MAAKKTATSSTTLRTVNIPLLRLMGCAGTPLADKLAAVEALSEEESGAQAAQAEAGEVSASAICFCSRASWASSCAWAAICSGVGPVIVGVTVEVAVEVVAGKGADGFFRPALRSSATLICRNMSRAWLAAGDFGSSCRKVCNSLFASSG